MSNTAYSRPPPVRDRGPLQTGVGVAALLLALPGLLSALEVLIIGEELSLLGARFLEASRNGTLDLVLTFIALTILGLSILRIVAASAMIRCRRWGGILFALVGLPCIVLDGFCFSIPIFFVWFMLDIVVYAVSFWAWKR